MTINSTASSASATKSTSSTQKLDTLRSQRYDQTSSQFIPVSAKIFTNVAGTVVQGGWVTFARIGLKNLGECSADPACLIGRTMISIKTLSPLSYEVAYWGDWIYDD